MRYEHIDCIVDLLDALLDSLYYIARSPNSCANKSSNNGASLVGYYLTELLTGPDCSPRSRQTSIFIKLKVLREEKQVN